MGEAVGSAAAAPGATGGDVARLVEERDRLRAEVGALRDQVARAQPRLRAPGRLRRVATAVLVVVASVVFAVAVVGVWARRTALDTDRWVETVGPIGEDPAVQAALAGWMTSELSGVIDAEAYFEEVLPERGQALAAPLAGALRGFVEGHVDAFLASDTFERLWVEANRRAHARVVDVLEGDVDDLQVADGQVVMNLVPVLNEVLARIGEASPEVFGRTVDLPTVTVDDLPDDAVARLEDALGRDLPEDFGQFTVFDAQRLDAAQDAVSLFDDLVVAAVFVAVVLVALTLAVSPYRRRTLLQLAVGIALAVVVVRRLGLRLEDDVVDLARPANRDAVAVVVGAFVDGLLDATAWALAAAAVVAVVALLTGPYGWARALRGRTAALARGIAAAVVAVVTIRPDDATVAWAAAHRELLQLGGALAGIVVLLAVDLSWPGLVVLALVVGGFELAVARLPELPPGDGEPAPRSSRRDEARPPSVAS